MERYYTIKDIMKMEGCGKDAAYALADILPHERRGKNNKLYFYKEDYDNYYKQKREKAIEECKKRQKKNGVCEEDHTVYQMRRLS